METPCTTFPCVLQALCKWHVTGSTWPELCRYQCMCVCVCGAVHAWKDDLVGIETASVLEVSCTHTLIITTLGTGSKNCAHTHTTCASGSPAIADLSCVCGTLSKCCRHFLWPLEILPAYQPASMCLGCYLCCYGAFWHTYAGPSTSGAAVLRHVSKCLCMEVWFCT